MRNAVWLALALAGSVAPRAVAEEPGGGGGLLTVEGGLVIWTLVVFGLLLYILKRSAWPVLLQAVREREQRLERQLAEAAQAREEAARLLEQQKQALERALASSATRSFSATTFALDTISCASARARSSACFCCSSRRAASSRACAASASWRSSRCSRSRTACSSTGQALRFRI